MKVFYVLCCQWCTADEEVADGAFETELLGAGAPTNIEEVKLEREGKGF